MPELFGVDFSAAALAGIERELRKSPLPQVRLEEANADELTGIEPISFDTIVINSVVQYSPTSRTSCASSRGPGAPSRPAEACSSATSAIWRSSKPSTHRSSSMKRPLLPRASYEKGSLDGSKKTAKLSIDSALFEAFGRVHRDVSEVAIELKRGAARNELTTYRYDVVITKCGQRSEGEATGAQWKARVAQLSAGERRVSGAGV